jgi:hypothetical protein
MRGSNIIECIFLIAIISIIKMRNSTEGSLGEVHILQKTAFGSEAKNS